MRRPSFVLFVTDQQRADHLGCYGNDIVRTPNIDRIAESGTRFEKFYVACPVCMPNRASLMTGRMPSQHLVRHNGIPLPRQSTTFVDLLRHEGYRTAMIGKGHLQNMTGIAAAPRAFPHEDRVQPPDHLRDGLNLGLDDPWYDGEAALPWRANPDHQVETPFYGFDHVRVCSLHGDQVEGHYTKWLREKRPDWADLTGPENAAPDPRYSVAQAWRTRVPEEAYPTRYVAEESLAFLEDHTRSGDDQPFFLMVSFPDPHHPFTPPGRYWDMYDPDDIPVPATFDDKLWEPLPPVPELREALLNTQNNPYVPQAVSERQAREAVALTYGMITMIDDAVGEVVSALERLGLAEDTVMAFTSDHGDYLGDRGAILKFGMHYDEIVRVPFLWSDPGAPQAGAVAQRLSGTIDIAPTILARAGINPSFGMQGLDAFDAAQTHPAMVVEDYAVSYVRDANTRAHFVSCITADHRLSRYESSDWGELYDLGHDPQERVNRWDDPASSPVRAKMHERLAERLMAFHDRALSPTGRA
jgi:arylsulfatase A-like enzyme